MIFVRLLNIIEIRGDIMEPITKFYEHYCPAAGKNVTVCEEIVTGKKTCMEHEECCFRSECRNRFITGGE